MGYYPFLILSALVTLPVLVAQWVGIFGLSHTDKRGAWWSMAAGAGFSTLGVLTAVGSMFHLPSSNSSLIVLGANAIPALGSLLFAIGFAIHGLRAARLANRAKELEQLTAAMSEEINRLKDHASQAP